MLSGLPLPWAPWRNLFPAVGPKPPRSLQQLDKNMPWISFWTLKLKPHQYSPNSSKKKETAMNLNGIICITMSWHWNTFDIWPESSCWIASRKPMLARGELRCIGATTVDEYRMPGRWWLDGWMAVWFVVLKGNRQAMLMIPRPRLHMWESKPGSRRHKSTRT